MNERVGAKNEKVPKRKERKRKERKKEKKENTRRKRRRSFCLSLFLSLPLLQIRH